MKQTKQQAIVAKLEQMAILTKEIADIATNPLPEYPKGGTDFAVAAHKRDFEVTLKNMVQAPPHHNATAPTTAEMIQEVTTKVCNAILATPTGSVREALCDANILLQEYSRSLEGQPNMELANRLLESAVTQWKGRFQTENDLLQQLRTDYDALSATYENTSVQALYKRYLNDEAYAGSTFDGWLAANKFIHSKIKPIPVGNNLPEFYCNNDFDSIMAKTAELSELTQEPFTQMSILFGGIYEILNSYRNETRLRLAQPRVQTVQELFAEFIVDPHTTSMSNFASWLDSRKRLIDMSDFYQKHPPAPVGRTVPVPKGISACEFERLCKVIPYLVIAYHKSGTIMSFETWLSNCVDLCQSPTGATMPKSTESLGSVFETWMNDDDSDTDFTTWLFQNNYINIQPVTSKANTPIGVVYTMWAADQETDDNFMAWARNLGYLPMPKERKIVPKRTGAPMRPPKASYVEIIEDLWNEYNGEAGKYVNFFDFLVVNAYLELPIEPDTIQLQYDPEPMQNQRHKIWLQSLYNEWHLLDTNKPTFHHWLKSKMLIRLIP